MTPIPALGEKALAIDLFCGLGGWTDGLLAEGWKVFGFDIEQHAYGDHRYPAQLVIQDVLTLHGPQSRKRSHSKDTASARTSHRRDVLPARTREGRMTRSTESTFERALRCGGLTEAEADYGETWLDDKGQEWRDCWQCGGGGNIEGDCTCMDDTCCCLYPEAPDCDVCGGEGVLRVRRKP